MRKKLYTFILFLLIVTTDVALGKDGYKDKTNKTNHKKQHHKDKIPGERTKRSLHEDREPFWPNRGKKLAETIDHVPEYHLADKNSGINKEPPFWGTKGRPESSSSENYNDLDYPEEYGVYNKNLNKCIDCLNNEHKDTYKYLKDRRDDVYPFWGNQERKYTGDGYYFEPFWASRGRRQENEPFWGNRGKKEDEPFWGNRGKKEDEPFWGNRGRRDDEPFWGNRGRRQDNEPFWGNRGRREGEPFWGNRGKRKIESFRYPKGERKTQLKGSILNTINDFENSIEHISRLRRSSNTNYWMNRGRDSKLKYLFNGPRNRLAEAYVTNQRPPEADTLHDSRIFADEPRYILVERSSRSSGEDDPFFISRGKKYNLNLMKTARDRRSAIEEIVKSMRNDPYYIARGKKDDIKNENLSPAGEYLKAKELICSAINLIMVKNDNAKIKREIDDNDGDRRTILKKLAAQLQMDPYFVSRGKKNDTHSNKDFLVEFINDVANKCN
ncbi:hypothetical protein K1T71_012307 [Dendrolimus kikuchii]|uniref:Uncharacterized protein n=1 Tax=Dendrolimus kikuchii TaxID=765133 RepID=A0ACC1CL63_9NEOP|nr:hypothetical protein K1T71_012307 [Dendrolimus kikuchii]